MDMMKSLLRNLGRKWSQQAVEIPLLTIEKNQGVHTYATVETGQLHFHSMPYHDTIPQKQSIVLDNLSVQELVSTITSMGYKATLTSEAGSMTSLKSFILMEQRDMPLGTLTAFTSSNWKLLYPLYRVLKQTEGDMDAAINQMYLPTAKGNWLDYFATFFSVRRQVNEEDSLFVRRILMSVFSPKVNNIAMAEIIGFRLRSAVDVNDIEPLLFEVVIDADYMNASEDTRGIIAECKAAGVDYLLHYAKTLSEDYTLYIADRSGKQWKDNDNKPAASIGLSEAQYGWQWQESTGGNSFDLNDDLTNDTPLVLTYVMSDVGWREMVQSYTEVYAGDSEALVMNVTLPLFREAMAAVTEAITRTTEQANTGNFRYADETGTIGFMVNVSDVNGVGMVTGENTSEAGSMVLTRFGSTVQTSQW